MLDNTTSIYNNLLLNLLRFEFSNPVKIRVNKFFSKIYNPINILE